MLTILLVAALLQTATIPTVAAAPADEAYVTETATMVAREVAQQRCVDQARPEGETVAACTDRRMAIRAAGNGPREWVPARYAPVRRRCEGGLQTANETVPVCILRVSSEDAQRHSLDIASQASPVAQPVPAPDSDPSNCRRRTTSDPDHGSASFTLTCGDPALDQQTNDMLDALLSRSTTP